MQHRRTRHGRGLRPVRQCERLFLATFRRMPTADAEGLDRIGGVAPEKIFGETRHRVRSGRDGPSALAVGVPRKVVKKKQMQPAHPTSRSSHRRVKAKVTRGREAKAPFDDVDHVLRLPCAARGDHGHTHLYAYACARVCASMSAVGQRLHSVLLGAKD